jgi:hypothetical protein
MNKTDTRKALESLEILCGQCSSSKIRRDHKAILLKYITYASKTLNIRCSTKGLGLVWKEMK